MFCYYNRIIKNIIILTVFSVKLLNNTKCFLLYVNEIQYFKNMSMKFLRDGIENRRWAVKMNISMN